MASNAKIQQRWEELAEKRELAELVNSFNAGEKAIFTYPDTGISREYVVFDGDPEKGLLYLRPTCNNDFELIAPVRMVRRAKDVKN